MAEDVTGGLAGPIASVINNEANIDARERGAMQTIGAIEAAKAANQMYGMGGSVGGMSAAQELAAKIAWEREALANQLAAANILGQMQLQAANTQAATQAAIASAQLRQSAWAKAAEIEQADRQFQAQFGLSSRQVAATLGLGIANMQAQDRQFGQESANRQAEFAANYGLNVNRLNLERQQVDAQLRAHPGNWVERAYFLRGLQGPEGEQSPGGWSAPMGYTPPPAYQPQGQDQYDWLRGLFNTLTSASYTPAPLRPAPSPQVDMSGVGGGAAPPFVYSSAAGGGQNAGQPRNADPFGGGGKVPGAAIGGETGIPATGTLLPRPAAPRRSIRPPRPGQSDPASGQSTSELLDQLPGQQETAEQFAQRIGGSVQADGTVVGPGMNANQATGETSMLGGGDLFVYQNLPGQGWQVVRTASARASNGTLFGAQMQGPLDPSQLPAQLPTQPQAAPLTVRDGLSPSELAERIRLSNEGYYSAQQNGRPIDNATARAIMGFAPAPATPAPQGPFAMNGSEMPGQQPGASEIAAAMGTAGALAAGGGANGDPTGESAFNLARPIPPRRAGLPPSIASLFGGVPGFPMGGTVGLESSMGLLTRPNGYATKPSPLPSQGPIVVGEHGPEIVQPPPGTTVTPMSNPGGPRPYYDVRPANTAAAGYVGAGGQYPERYSFQQAAAPAIPQGYQRPEAYQSPLPPWVGSLIGSGGFGVRPGAAIGVGPSAYNEDYGSGQSAQGTSSWQPPAPQPAPGYAPAPAVAPVDTTDYTGTLNQVRPGTIAQPAPVQPAANPLQPLIDGIGALFPTAPKPPAPAAGPPIPAQAPVPVTTTPARTFTPQQLAGQPWLQSLISGTVMPKWQAPAGPLTSALLPRGTELPAPHQISPQQWLGLSPQERQMLQSLYESMSITPETLQWGVASQMPGTFSGRIGWAA